LNTWSTFATAATKNTKNTKMGSLLSLATLKKLLRSRTKMARSSVPLPDRYPTNSNNPNPCRSATTDEKLKEQTYLLRPLRVNSTDTYYAPTTHHLKQQRAGGDYSHYLGYSAQRHPAGDAQSEFEGELVAQFATQTIH
jgi:hypothetical protein